MYDRDFTVVTDHKPLLHMLTPKSNPPPRIQNWMLKLKAYDFEIQHVSGCNMASDCLSCTPMTNVSFQDNAEQFLNRITTDAQPKACSLAEIASATNTDEILPHIINFVSSNNWPRDPRYRQCYNNRENLSVYQDFLVKGQCIFIPQSLQQRILTIVHSQHQGINKTKALLREKVWWPSINADVEQLIKHCHACQVTASSNSKCAPITMSEIPSQVWHTLAVDIQGPYPTGEYILVLIDYRSRYPVIALLKTVTTKTILNSLLKTFSLFGFPSCITSDNRPQFTSVDFTAVLKKHDISHRRVTPYWPAANGEVERMNCTLKKAIQCAHEEGKIGGTNSTNFF